MEVYFIHHMKTGLGEIFSSWLSIININNLLRKEGYKTHLLIECNKLCGYFSVETIFTFFNKAYLSDIFSSIEINNKVNKNKLYLYKKTPQLEDPMYSIYSTQDFLPNKIEKYLNLKANEVYKKKMLLTLGPLVRSNVIPLELPNHPFSVHHVRAVDQMESLSIAKLLFNKIKPFLKDGDYILSNSRTIKDYISDNTDLELNFLSSSKVSNHPYTNMPEISIDTKTDSLLQAYKEMVIASNAKKLYLYSAWDTVSSFLILSSIKQIPFSHKHIKEMLSPH